MSKLFDDDSDSDIGIKTNNEYAKNYGTWRKKEELNKLKAKYGEDGLHMLSEESSSSSDEEEVEFTEEAEKKFFQTLSYLKNKDPRIYDTSVTFFDENDTLTKPKKKKEKPFTINDYERKIMLEHGGKFSEDDAENEGRRSPTYVEQQEQSKRDLIMGVAEDDDDDGELFSVKQDVKEDSKEDELKEWLSGKKDDIHDKEAATELEPLRAMWTDPGLPKDEKFLRDYILSNQHSQPYDSDDDGDVPVDLQLSDEEELEDKQEEFEHKYNFRFEEPDQDFIKRYPRTIGNSLRKTDGRRKVKRAEIKERKQQEKEEKFRELQKLQELKRQELQEKIDKLKEITGSGLQFDDKDLDDDFDPDSHDKKMQALFNDEFYQGPEGDQKPEFPEFDDYLEIENWDKWHENRDRDGENGDKEELEDNADHCEDDDFNMDCDYDPKAAVQKELLQATRGKKKRKRKPLFAKVLSQPRPAFDPQDKAFIQYMDEYYKYDCEDIIDDIPCKFKYREVVPNNFGLTTEEMLSANDKELNKWYSLKKALQRKPDNVEEYDKKTYERKAQNLAIKRKILPSLFKAEEEQKKNAVKEMIDNAESKTHINAHSVQEIEQKKSTLKNDSCEKSDDLVACIDKQNISAESKKRNKSKWKNKKQNDSVNIEEKTAGDVTNSSNNSPNEVVLESDQVAYIDKKNDKQNVSPKSKKCKKSKRKNKHPIESVNIEDKPASDGTNSSNSPPKKLTLLQSSQNDDQVATSGSKKQKKRKRKNKTPKSDNNEEIANGNGPQSKKRKLDLSQNEMFKKAKKLQKSSKNKQMDVDVGISDARFSAFGINPKKFKNKLKYGNKS